MKKLLLLVLCVITMCVALVGCDDEIGKDLDDYNKLPMPPEKEAVVLDLYIIADEANATSAEKTVNQRINAYLSEKYKTTLSIHFLHADEYKQGALNAVKESGASKADIVLINSKALFDELMEGGYLAALDTYLDSSTIKTIENYELINKNIPKIKKDIPGCLWEASATTPDADGNTCFMIPNNHVIGSYKYLVIDRQQFFAKGYSENLLANGVVNDIDAFVALLENEGIDLEIDENGSYADKAEYEKNGKICVVLENPTVDAEYVCQSGFSVVAGTGYEDRAIEIIYALNTDKTFKNLLQYGDEITHYTIIGENVVRNSADSGETYIMNNLYTGSIFNALYCENEGWTPEERANADIQNKNAVCAPIVVPPVADEEN